jgi:circadian clock protein KaiC
VDRVTTGNPKLDLVLGGGIPANSLTIVAGAPGTGKTMLAQQFVFANASPEQSAVYLTTLSEPAPKLLRYLQDFTFFDENKLFGDPPPVYYHDIAAEAKTRGFGALLEIIDHIIEERSPTFLVIDSFKALRDVGAGSSRFREVLFDLAGRLSAYACTTLLLGEYTSAELDTMPEFAVVDGIIHLVNQKHGVRDERYLRVLKLRGSAFRSGEHAFRLGAQGISVFPRLVSPSHPEQYSLVNERISTGVPDLDAAAGGGLLRGSSTLLAGPTGSGKTILSLHFLFQGAAQSEPGLLVSFQESPTMLRRNVTSLGWDVTQFDEGGLLTHLYVSPVEMNIDDVMEKVVALIDTKGIRRIAIDSLADLQATAPDDDRYRSYIYAMMQYFAASTITTYVTLESTTSSTDVPVSSTQVSYLCDNVIILRYSDAVNEVRRSLSVIKTRGSDHHLRVRSFRIRHRGVELDPAPSMSGPVDVPSGDQPGNDNGG